MAEFKVRSVAHRVDVGSVTVFADEDGVLDLSGLSGADQDAVLRAAERAEEAEE